MAAVDENAFTILRVLREKGITLEKAITLGEIKALTGLADDEFDQAEGYLLQRKYITGAGGKDQSQRWITPQGIDYVRQEMSTRIPLSEVAERVLKYVERTEPPPSRLRTLGGDDLHSVNPEDISDALGLSPDDLDRALQELEDERLACSAVKNQSILSGWGIRTATDGRQAIRRGFKLNQAPVIQANSSPPSSDVQHSNRVFIVHGHDEEMKQAVARTLEKVGLEPVILHEQPNQGKTIIEKFSEYASSSAFAVVLLSPDDMAYPRGGEPEKARPRARQNVILELGFFLGKLGRERVFVLYKEAPGFEIPSDYAGVLYTQYDSIGHWKFDLARELKATDYDIDLNLLT